MLARPRHGPIRSLRRLLPVLRSCLAPAGSSLLRSPFGPAIGVLATVPLRVATSSNLLSDPPASVRRADYFRPPRSAQTPAECFLSVRFAPDFLMLRSSIFVRSASSCALADSVRPALVPRSTRTVSAAAPAFASLTTSKRCARPHSTRGDPLPPETTTCPALVPRSGQ